MLFLFSQADTVEHKACSKVHQTMKAQIQSKTSDWWMETLESKPHRFFSSLCSEAQMFAGFGLDSTAYRFWCLPFWVPDSFCSLCKGGIGCRMKSFVFCHCGSTKDQYCQQTELWVCVFKGRQMSLSTCENREALKDVAALLSSYLLVCMGIMCKCALHSSADILDSQHSCCDGPPDSTAKCKEGGLQPENLIKF